MAKEDWNEIIKVLKIKMAQKQPNIKVAEMTEWLGLSSTSIAYFYLVQLEEMGVVKRVENGTKSEWFLMEATK